MGYVTLGPAAFNVFHRGSDVRIIAAGSANPSGPGTTLPLVVRAELIDSGLVKSVADLKGRKIAINGKGGTEYGLAKALSIGDLRTTDVDVVMLPFPEMLVGLSTGAIDAGLMLQPLGSQAVATGVGKILTDYYNPNSQGAVLVANTHFLDQNPVTAATFLDVHLEAVRRLSDGKLKNDDHALTARQKYTNTSAEVIRSVPDPCWPKDGRVLVDKLLDYAPLNTASASFGP